MLLRQRLTRIIVFSTMFFLTKNSFAGAPFISDDPDTLPKGIIQTISFAAYDKSENEVDIAFPGVQINYGLTDNLQLGITGEYLFNYPHETGEPNTSGMGDTQLEAEYRFVQETETHPQIAFTPTYYFPTGNVNRGLGNGRPWVELPFWLQKSWNSWTAYGGGGYGINSEPSQKNFLFGGFVLEKNLNEKWMLGAEVFSSGSTSQENKASTLLNLGGYYHFTKNINLLFSAGHSIAGQRNIIGYLGTSFNF